jgi:nitroreductase
LHRLQSEAVISPIERFYDSGDPPARALPFADQFIEIGVKNVATLTMTPDELLTTTRAVRKRLDFSRPVESSLIEECLAIAQQAPTASNMQNWHFVVVSDARKRAEIAQLYLRSFEAYRRRREATDAQAPVAVAARAATQMRMTASATYLAEHLHEVPVFVIPCIEGRTDAEPVARQAAQWGTIMPATWSFMLAARARGLGTVLTSLHLVYEKEAAQILGISYADVMQCGLVPVAYTKGSGFKAAPREPLSTMVHWDRW